MEGPASEELGRKLKKNLPLSKPKDICSNLNKTLGKLDKLSLQSSLMGPCAQLHRPKHSTERRLEGNSKLDYRSFRCAQHVWGLALLLDLVGTPACLWPQRLNFFHSQTG